MSKERILITVKTYPTLSSSYTELVCTAGLRMDGTWVRIYPAPFRFLEQDKQYRKYQWIELELDKNPSDPRPESFRPRDIDAIRGFEVVGTGTKRDWAERKRLILKKGMVHTNLNIIIQATKNNEYSLAIFKPMEIVDFVVETAEEVQLDYAKEQERG